MEKKKVIKNDLSNNKVLIIVLICIIAASILSLGIYLIEKNTNLFSNVGKQIGSIFKEQEKPVVDDGKPDRGVEYNTEEFKNLAVQKLSELEGKALTPEDIEITKIYRKDITYYYVRTKTKNNSIEVKAKTKEITKINGKQV